jgi:hypothetical protein
MPVEALDQHVGYRARKRDVNGAAVDTAEIANGG